MLRNITGLFYLFLCILAQPVRIEMALIGKKDANRRYKNIREAQGSGVRW